MPYLSRLILPAAFGLAYAVAGAPAGHSQERAGWLERCEERSSRNQVTVCAEKEMTLPAVRGRLVVNARPNGGITVTGGSRSDIRMVARIQAHARREADARAILDEVEIRTDGEIRATGPRARDHEGWSVSFVLEVPRNSDLGLASTNGGISVAGVAGDLELTTTNGGLTLAAVAGSVRGRTTNGGVTVDLEGSSWQGSGLDLETTNGGVRLRVPESYNARLEASTVHGGMQFDFPVTVQGRMRRQLTTDLGSGGAPIRVATTNGGVTVQRK